ncbi:MAG: 30S ribosomal protein S17 [Nitrosomonas sp.]|nr:30S ribosomal protein S17 [Nitrosomonas sp.]MBX3616442.1 30S ribosomal protein S17 [Nitrosomonas sp.]
MNNENIKRSLSGKVVNKKMNKTVTILIERRLKHSLYEKFITRSKKYQVHDEENNSEIGDIVLIEECRPISKTKNWKVKELIAKKKND